MTLSACINEYVRHRRSLGVQFHGEEVQLSAFAKSVGDVSLTDITPEAVRRYRDGKGPVTRAWFARFHTVTGFYRFAIRRQYLDRSPLPPGPPKPAAEFSSVHLLRARHARAPGGGRRAPRRGLASFTPDQSP